MRTFVFHSKRFAKKYKKLPIDIKERLEYRLNLFMNDMFNPVLSLHKLKGDYDSCMSINVTSDVRIILERVSSNVYKLRDVGTHSELYE